MTDNVRAAIGIGLLVGFAAFALANWIQAYYVRQVGGIAYYRGWEDCRKHILKFMTSTHVRPATAQSENPELGR